MTIWSTKTYLLEILVTFLWWSDGVLHFIRIFRLLLISQLYTKSHWLSVFAPLKVKKFWWVQILHMKQCTYFLVHVQFMRITFDIRQELLFRQNVTRVHLSVARDAVWIDNVLESTSKFVNFEVGWWHLLCLNFAQKRRHLCAIVLLQ